jgi:hypothetical protein
MHVSVLHRDTEPRAYWHCITFSAWFGRWDTRQYFWRSSKVCDSQLTFPFNLLLRSVSSLLTKKEITEQSGSQ